MSYIGETKKKTPRDRYHTKASCVRMPIVMNFKVGVRATILPRNSAYMYLKSGVILWFVGSHFVDTCTYK